MNSIHNNGKNDKSLDDGLDRLGKAYGQLHPDEPPELLDQAILNSAHRAVEKKPHWMKFGWLHGLTTAAVFVLAFSLILNQREQAPAFENDMGVSEPALLEREMVAKKRSQIVQPNELRIETKEEGESLMDLRQSIKAAAPASAASEAGLDDQAGEPLIEFQISTYAEDTQIGKSDSADKDTSADAPMLEEQLVTEADALAAPVEAGAASNRVRKAAAQPAIHETEAPNAADPEPERRLLEIIDLKNSGDEKWISELKLFKEDFPDYPLPEELKN